MRPTSKDRISHLLAVGTIVLCFLGTSAASSDQEVVPRFGASRSGYTPQGIRLPLRPEWTFKDRHKPRPAWREPAWEPQRIDVDYAFPISAGGGRAYMASSADHSVRALSLADGREQWRFFTEGPVRLAPAVHQGKVYVGSDDGAVYCLDGRSGDLVWKYRPRIPDERLIGNEQMISRWPGRSGVLVDGDKAYTTFGMWSAEGIVVVCLDAATGAVRWKNDAAGTHYMTQPHFEAMGGVSPQGYLAVCGDVLVVPCGRATPALFDANTGALRYNESEGLFPGGAWTMTHGDLVFTPCGTLKKPNPESPGGEEAPIAKDACLVAIRAATGEEVFHLRDALWGVMDPHGQMTLIGPDGLKSVALDDVLRAAVDAQQRISNSEGHFVEAAKLQRWTTPVGRVYEVVQAGSTVIVGGRETLACYDAKGGRKTWQTQVAGDVRDLLLVDGALLVSTTEGEVHCFRPGAQGPARVVRPEHHDLPAAEAAKQRVAALLAAGGVDEGYALVLGEARTADLAQLARQSKLVVHWAAGEREVAKARAELDGAGLYGTRVAIHRVSARPLPYVDYFANLVLLQVDSAEQLDRTPAAEVYRVLRPCGGVAVIACPEEVKAAVEEWLEAGGVPPAECKPIDVGVRIERGPLAGAGTWTHQYADSGKSCASDDRRVRLPLEVLWFGSLGPADIVSRHYRTPAPLAVGARMFVPGMNHLYAVDAYNGRMLWQRDLPGVGRWPAAYRGGCIAADADSVYALQGKTCLRLDAASGETQSTYRVPVRRGERGAKPSDAEEGPVWEFLAVTDDCVVGTYGKPNIKRLWWSQAHPANALLFVLDKASGDPRWTYEPRGAIDSSAIAVEGDKLLLIDGLPDAEFYTQPRRPKAKPRTVYRYPKSEHPRLLKALDLHSGEELWRTEEVGPGQNSLWASGGVVLATIPSDGANTLGSSYRMRWKGPRVSAFSADDGKLLWTRDQGGVSPVIVEDVVYLPEALDLRTGEPVLSRDPLTGNKVPFAARCGQGCGKYAGCPGALMMRSGSLGFYDLDGRSGTYHVPNMRASCWINMIPASGLVLVPEGSSSCPCAYNYKTSLALMPAERHNHWGLFGGLRRGKQDRITELRVNFGAPGDRSDAKGNVWFAFPRPATTGPRGAGGMGKVPYDDLPMELLDENGAVKTVARHPDWTPLEDCDAPWLYTCGLAGPVRLRIRLDQQGAKPRTCALDLYFCDVAAPGESATDASASFDVKLQGKQVWSNLNVRREAGGPNRTLVKKTELEVGDVLMLELMPRAGAIPVLRGMRLVEKTR